MMIGRFRQMETDAGLESEGFDTFDLRLGDVMRGERATRGKSLLDIQRELKIKATYIAAIENADPSAFETPGFIAGYVRSYARYLGLDPDWAFRAFCAEGDFEPAHSMSHAASLRSGETARAERSGDPFGERVLGLAPARSGIFAGVGPSALGSVVVLLGLIGLIGYGGYAVLNEVQKVQFVPVDQSPQVVADIDPLSSVAPAEPELGEAGGLASVAPRRLDRIYRPEALEVPVMVARDGPIATLDPRRMGTLASAGDVSGDGLPAGGGSDSLALAGLAPEDLLPPVSEPQIQVVGDDGPEVVLFAVRPSWVRVRSSDGTTIYEQIMNEGDRFVLPKTEEPATLRTGESGAIYFQVNGEPYGPAGRPGTITGNLSLDAATLTEKYEIADLSRDTALARVVVELRADPPQIPGRDEAEVAVD